jgi:transposase
MPADIFPSARRTRLFVMTLSYSRKAIRLLTFRSSSRICAELHGKAFRRLGGSTRAVALNNLKEGVLAPDIYDPTLNPLYRDVLAYYGAVALPCRIQDPDRTTPAIFNPMAGRFLIQRI